MADIKKVQKTTSTEDKKHRFRITLTSKNVKALEKVSNEITGKARGQAYKDTEKVQVRGPVRFPTRVLRITTRKSPCGEGTNSWDRFEMKIHKRIIDLRASQRRVKDITSIQVESGVNVEVSLIC